MDKQEKIDVQKVRETVEEVLEQLIKKLGMKDLNWKVEEEEEKIKVFLETDQPGLVIGYHGQTLDSLQHLLKLIVFGKLGVWPFISVDVDGYRESRRKAVEGMAKATAQRVKLSGRLFSLPPMSASERRIAHLCLAEDEDVVTESTGKGKARKVVVKPKKEVESKE